MRFLQLLTLSKKLNVSIIYKWEERMFSMAQFFKNTIILQNYLRDTSDTCPQWTGGGES